MAHNFHWLDVDRIAEELCDRHPQAEPFQLSFLELRNLVHALPGFAEDPEHPCNERILETIQMLWDQERSGEGAQDDRD